MKLTKASQNQKMAYIPENALIVQSDRTILLEAHSPKAEAVREAIASQNYRLTPFKEGETLPA